MKEKDSKRIIRKTHLCALFIQHYCSILCVPLVILWHNEINVLKSCKGLWERYIYYTNGEWGAPEVLKTLKTPKICSPCKTTTASFYFFVCFSFTMAVIYWTQEYYFLLYSLIVSSSKISLLQFTETKTYFRNYFFSLYRKWCQWCIHKFVWRTNIILGYILVLPYILSFGSLNFT